MSEASTAEAAPVEVERTKHKPDIGRIVLLHGLFPNRSSPDDTRPAIVTYVGVNGPAEPTCIEVEVFGGPYVALRGWRTAVVHLYDPLPDGAARPSPNGESLWAEWMPFQHAQHEAQAKIDETTKRWSELAAGERENSVIDAAVRELMGMVAANRPACNCIVCQARRDEGTKAVRELMGMVAANRPACNCIVCQARRDEGTKATDTLSTVYTAAPVDAEGVAKGDCLEAHAAANGSSVILVKGHVTVGRIEGDGAKSLLDALREPGNPGVVTMRVRKVSSVSGFIEAVVDAAMPKDTGPQPDPSDVALRDLAKAIFRKNVIDKLGGPIAIGSAIINWETLTDKDCENWLTIARRMRSGKYAREEMSDFDLDDDDD